ncbi:MAG TPA: 50S ribosomal protein L11 methyltransferase, partial [Pyrinomonadaceae bacterium]|nr:50S ribosomal protein L11 methyltransferase [Pyrinomonadaceae bacterium]
DIDFYVGSIAENTLKVDFVLANLTIDVITPLLPLLLEKFEKVLVLSGILQEQESVIVEELKKFGIETPEINHSGEWISVTIKK